jgi:hypothetical protein
MYSVRREELPAREQSWRKMAVGGGPVEAAKEATLVDHLVHKREEEERKREGREVARRFKFPPVALIGLA